MRTTLTLEPDVAAMLAAHRKRYGLSLKEAVNQALRRGLDAETRTASPREPFRTGEADHGRILVPSVDDIGDILERLDEGAE